MNSDQEEEETGPSVESTDPEERVQARRERIKQRVEAERRAARGDDDSDKKEVKELSRSRKQIVASRQRLSKLKNDGSELVSNIRVAGDAREANRRVEDEEVKRLRKEKLEAEAKAGNERFEEITKKWEQALQKDIPQELHEMLMQQKGSCDAMIDEKNKLINEFQTELKQKDDHYVKDLKKQAEDIDLMIERMEEQVKNLTKACREELNEIEKAFVLERKEILESHGKKWEQKMQDRRDREEEYLKLREKRVDDYEAQLQQLRVQDAEEYNMVKIKLETDVQILEQQLQQMKATYQLNQEKLEYNFQVLKKRDEENTLTKSQQKRKITKLQDNLNNTKIKLAKQEKQFKDENNNLMEDYKRITEQFKELQKKSKYFMSTDAKKFHDVWCMNEEEAKELVQKVLEESRIISEHQLGLEWMSPDTSFMDNVGPLTSEQSQQQQMSAQEVVQEVLSKAALEEKRDLQKDDTDLELQEDEAVRSEILQKISAKTVKKILELLCDEAGFLVESKLNKLLKPLEKDEQSLMRLDAIFTALGVDTEEDIQKVVQYFLLHIGKTPAASAMENRQDEDGSAPNTARSKSQVSQKSGDQDQDLDEDNMDAEIRQVTGIEDLTPRSTASDGMELIHPNEVIKALRAFVDDNHKPTKDSKRTIGFKIAAGEERDESDDSEYWAKYANILPPKTEQLWDALLDGLEKYSETLTARSGLITETDALRQQNSELRMLLHQYINSKVNAELEIPPTRVLQLDLNPQ